MNVRMNAQSGLKTDFSALVLKAILDNTKWRVVLEALMVACGAVVGVISLREFERAGLYFPEEAATELYAPLIVGIPPQHVASYFDHYQALDQWTPIEHAHHPDQPYFMSEHLCLADLQASEFFQGWLRPQGISECLVAEVYRSQRHWVALNLLFDQTAFARRDEIMALVAAMLPAMRTGWEVSERLISSANDRAASLGYLESWPVPCLILDEELVVTSANARGLGELPGHLPLSAPVVVGDALPLRDGPLRDVLEQLRVAPADADGAGALLHMASERPGYTLQISPVSSATDVVGKRRAQFLVLVNADLAPPAVGERTPRIWETKGLTPQQAAVVKWVAEGGFASEFADQHGIAKKTAYDHLAAARQKLGGITASDIYTSHQALLMIEK